MNTPDLLDVIKKQNERIESLEKDLAYYKENYERMQSKWDVLSMKKIETKQLDAQARKLESELAIVKEKQKYLGGDDRPMEEEEVRVVHKTGPLVKDSI